MTPARPGTVYLVGAGPGDAGLVTNRALDLVRSADVLLVDRLVPRELVAEAHPEARRIDVGKTAGDHAMPQEQINERLVEEARAGASVVRIKGGDPYVFGRGGEEALHCRAAGIPVEVVPGVTSAFAACAAAGIPVTHRDVARHVTVGTASAGRDGQGDPDYEWLAGSDGTLVLLMGLRRVSYVAQRLMAAGMPADRPAAVVSRGTTSEQRTIVATLASIGKVVEQSRVASPAIIVVGDVVGLRDGLDWFERRPLFGTRAVVTRARAQSSELVARLQELGAQVVELPSIRVERLDAAPLDSLIARLAHVSTLVFTSRNGVDAFFDQLAAAGLDTRALHGTTVAVVGEATAEACSEQGLAVDVLPPRGSRTSMGLLEALGSHALFGTRCAVVRAEVGDDRFLDGLRQLGAEVELVPAYRTAAEPLDEAQVEQLLGAHVVTFTSESTVRNVAVGIPADRRTPAAVTIGPTTTAAALAAGFRVLQEAATPSISSLVDAVVDRAAENRYACPWRHAAASAPATPD